jgi:hypothetical protein
MNAKDFYNGDLKITKENSEVTSFEHKKVVSEIAVRKATRLENSLNVIISLLLSLVGGVGFVLELGLLHFPISNLFVFLFLWLILPFSITTIALFRNRILEKLFNSVSTKTYLEFAKVWEPYSFVVFIATIVAFVLGFALPNNLDIKILPLLILGLLLPFYYIFNVPLTSGGEIKILFENLLSNLSHFSKRNIFWEQIAGKIERLLEIGNIEVSKDDLIYYFNAELWETKDDITVQLRDIEAWLLDRKSPVFNSITQIIPETCFRAGNRKNFLRSIIIEPTTTQVDVIKVLSPVIIAIVFAALILIHPELGSQIISHFPTF